jgi:intracellular sulfur oxidation DsrE/DsrF family protein
MVVNKNKTNNRKGNQVSSKKNKSRRVFLGKMIGAATAAALPVAKMSAASAASAEMDSQDSWLKGINGEHKCMFDFPAHKNGAGLVHIFNYITTYQAAYGADVSDVSTIGTLYSVGANSSITMAFTDEMWAKYKFGEYHSLDDPQTGKPAVRNLFYKTMDGDALPRVGNIGPFPDASVSALQEKMGTTFLLCNNAVTALSMDLSMQGHGETEAIIADLKNHVQPGVHLVPAMVIAIEKAQAAGISYNKQ